MLSRNAGYYIMKRSKRKALPNNKLGRLTEKLEHLKASLRAKVEHPFHVVKNLLRHRKTRYRALAKNTAQFYTLFAFANLLLASRCFTITDPVVRPDRRKTRSIASNRTKNGLERLASCHCTPALAP